MIVVLKHNVPEEKRNQLINWLRNQNIDVHPSLGEYQTVLGLVGDTSRIDMSLLESLDIVDSVKRVSDPFKCCNRKFHPDDTVVSVGDAKFGGGHFAMIAGPCSVESAEQIVYVATVSYTHLDVYKRQVQWWVWVRRPRLREAAVTASSMVR